MKQKIKETILSILVKKRVCGDVFPLVTSIEVAHELKMNAVEVERIPKEVEGIIRGRTLNHEYYYE